MSCSLFLWSFIMKVGFICSRKNESILEIVKGSPPSDVKKFDYKLYCLLKPYIFDLKEN